MLKRLLTRLPDEQETAALLQRLETSTGLKADRVSAALESTAERSVRGLKSVERQASRLAGFAERVSKQVGVKSPDER
jgi:hypothetical protein